MSKSYSLTGSFNPDEQTMLAGVYQDVCRAVEKKGSIVLTARVREAIAISIFDLASAGERDLARMRRLATREVEAYGGVQRTLERASSGERPARRPPASRLDDLSPPAQVGQVTAHAPEV